MKQGALIFDEQADRYDIRFDLADYYGGPRTGIWWASAPTTFPACGCGFKPSRRLPAGLPRRDSSCRKK